MGKIDLERYLKKEINDKFIIILKIVFINLRTMTIKT